MVLSWLLLSFRIAPIVALLPLESDAEALPGEEEDGYGVELQLGGDAE
jgi:hypothetical protein